MDATHKNDPLDVSAINAQIPRNVRLDGSSIGTLSFGLLLLLSGLAVLVWLALDGAKDLRIQSTLLQGGRSVNGTITSSSVNRGGTSVKYTFTAEGAAYSGYAEMKSDNFSVPGDPRLISIRYLPVDPHVNQPANWKLISVWDLFPFLLLITMTAVGVKVVMTAQRMISLVRNGYVVLGKVTGCASKNKLFTVFYVFESQNKEEIEGSCDLQEEYEAGAAIPVIYLRGSPKRNSKYPVTGLSTTQ